MIQKSENVTCTKYMQKIIQKSENVTCTKYLSKMIQFFEKLTCTSIWFRALRTDARTHGQRISGFFNIAMYMASASLQPIIRMYDG